MTNEVQTMTDQVVSQGVEPVVSAPMPEPGFFQQLMDLIINGGPVMLVLALASVTGVTVVLVKVSQFVMNGVWSRRSVETVLEHWQKGRVDQAIQQAEAMRHPAGIVLLTAMRGTLRRGVGDASMREEVERVAMREIAKFNRHLNILDIISQLAPLLGLLGTILGMIAAFQALQGAGSRADPAVLAGGIWEALLTTAAGLTVAIPMTVFYFLLDGCVQSMRQCMEDAVTRVFTWSHDAEVVPLHAPVNRNAAGVRKAQAMDNYALS